MVDFLTGSESLTTITNNQVYKATHDGVGNRLPLMERSFISFTFGGKSIEDFGLIVITDGDRMERASYTSFSDAVTDYDTLDGQIYWGTKLEPNSLTLKLATDEITEQQLDDFKEWFGPGKERELILAEHPNRAIIARVKESPTFSLLPFSKEVSILINSQAYTTYTTLYRGEITLSFIMSEPCWYSKLNYMPDYVDKITLEPLAANSSNVNKITTLEDKDMIKIMLEDGIPYQNNLSGDMFLGGNLLVTSESRVDFANVGQSYLGVITTESEGLNVSNNSTKKLFYSGNAISYPIIKFTLTPAVDVSGSVTVSSGTYTSRYIKVPKNKYVGNNYSYFKIGNNYFYFTTPSILNGVNQAIDIFRKISFPVAAADIISEITTSVSEQYSRAWAIACLNCLGVEQITREKEKLYLLNNMLTFIAAENNIIPNNVVDDHETSDNSVLRQIIAGINNGDLTFNPITFTFNSKTGEATGKFYVRVANSKTDIMNNRIITLEQNVGDMVCSKYLTIEGKNYLNSNGIITDYKIITSNENLTNVIVLFQNMYL